MNPEKTNPNSKKTRADWRDLSAQKLTADPGPLGVAKIKPVARVSFAEIIEIVERLNPGLENDQQIQLIEALRKIMADYMGPLVYAAKQRDRARSIQLLDLISRESAVLAQHLSEIDRDFLVELDDWRKARTPGEGERYFHFLHLERNLRLLSEATSHIHDEIPRGTRGRSSDENLGHAIKRLYTAIQKAGLEIRAVEAGAGKKRKRVEGVGGALLLALYYNFNRHISETTLAGEVLKLQKPDRQPKPQTRTDDKGS